MSSNRVYYLAICTGCAPPLPVPFNLEKDRNTWAAEHERGTGLPAGEPAPSLPILTGTCGFTFIGDRKVVS